MLLFMGNRIFLSAGSDAGTGSAPPAGQDTSQPPSGEQKDQKPADSEDSAGRSEDSDGTPEKPEDPTGESETSDSTNLDAIGKLIDSKFKEERKKAAMSDAERKDYELQEKEKELEEREKSISVRELKANAVRLLAETGLPSNVADVVMGADMKETARNIKTFKECLDKEVQRQVAERLKGKAPGAGNVPPGETDSVKSQFLQGLNGI